MARYDQMSLFDQNQGKGVAAEPKKDSPKKDGPKEDSSLEEWQRYFQVEYKALHRQSGHYFYLEDRYLSGEFFQKIEAFSKNWSEEAKFFFLFHGILFMMRRMEDGFTSSKPTNPDYYYYHPQDIQNEFLARLLTAWDYFKKKSVSADLSFYMLPALSALRKMLFREGPCFFDWLYFYRILWSNCFYQPALVQEEIRTLDEVIRLKNSSELVRYRSFVCKAHFEYVIGNDSKAITLLKKAGAIQLQDHLIHLYSLAETKKFDRLVIWLRWLTVQAPQYSYDQRRNIFNYWLAAGTGGGYWEETLGVLKSYLPESVSFYRQALLAVGDYQKWAELQIYFGRHEILDPQEVKKVEAADVSLLLPLYHQLVIRLVEKRSRVSYRSSVSVLKKLRTYYKKLKRSDEWERYFSQLTVRYSRLRAFQEELRKGRLA